MKTMRVMNLSRIIWAILIVLLLVGLCLAFSLFKKKNDEPKVEPVSKNEIKVIDYIDSKNLTINFDEGGINAEGLDVKNNTITLKESASYSLSGNNTEYKIVIDAKNSVVRLVFNGFTSNEVEELISVKDANKVILELAENTTNTINSTSEEINADNYVINSNVDFEIKGTGNLTVTSANKFLNVKGNLNYDNAVIQLNDLNNALTIEKNIKINSGVLYANTTNESIICNGNFEINGGKLITSAETGKSATITGVFLINNGQVIIASSEEIQKPNANSLQNTLILNFIDSTDKLLVLHDTQEITLAYQNEYQFKHLLYSNSKLSEKSYILYAGGKVSGKNAYGIYEVTDYMEDYQLTSTDATNDTFNASELINIYNDVAKK